MNSVENRVNMESGRVDDRMRREMVRMRNHHSTCGNAMKLMPGPISTALRRGNSSNGYEALKG